MSKYQMSNVKHFTSNVINHNMKIRQMSKYENLACQTPRGY